MRLGASQTVGTYVMPRLIARFRADHPGVSAALTVDATRRVCDAVAAGALDAAIVGGDVPADLAPSLSVAPYAADEIVLVVPSNHPLARGAPPGKQAPPIPPSALDGVPLVALNAGSSSRAALDAVLAAAGVPPASLRVDTELSSVEAVKEAVSHGLGVAFVSRVAVAKETALGLLTIVPLEGVKLTRTLSLVTPAVPPASLAPAPAKLLADLAAGADGAAGRLPLRSVVPAARPWDSADCV